MDERQVISTVEAPRAVGPYSQAIRSGDFVFTAGQIGLDPETGVLVGEEVEAQAEQVMRNLEAVLRAAGATVADVIKSTVYLVDLADFSKVNEIYASLFSQAPPARTTVEVSALPLGAKVEVELVARLQA